MPTPIRLSEDVHPLTTFRNHSAEMLRNMKRKKRAVVLTVNGRPAAVVQSVEEYERLLDLASHANAREGIRQGLDDVAHKRSRPAADVIRELRKEYGVHRPAASARRA